MTTLSHAQSVTTTASQDDDIGSLPAIRERVVRIRRLLPIPFSVSGIAHSPADQLAKGTTEHV